MKARLINIGRTKFNGMVEVKSAKHLLKEISKHLFSRDVSLEYEDGSKKAQVIVGGWRVVGEVELEDAVFRTLALESVTIEKETHKNE